MNHFIASDKSKKGQYIVREGTSGDTFYIISDGDVKVTKKSAGKEEEIRSLTKGDYFGEQVSTNTVQNNTVQFTTAQYSRLQTARK